MARLVEYGSTTLLGTKMAVSMLKKCSVVDPDHFDADPDPTSEKTGCGSDHALHKIL
jgi:hypothetical protein